MGTKINVEKVHCSSVHSNEKATKLTANYLKWEITCGKLAPCIDCTKAKAKHKNVCKDSRAEKAAKPGERIYLDFLKVTVGKGDGTDFDINQKHWKIMVEECTGKKWCDFTMIKMGMVEHTCGFLNMMKTHGVLIKCI